MIPVTEDVSTSELRVNPAVPIPTVKNLFVKLSVVEIPDKVIISLVFKSCGDVAKPTR